MRPLRRRPEPAPSLPTNPVLQQIVQRGGDLSQPRDWVHFVYFPDEGSARAASERIAAVGSTVAVKPSGAEWYVAADQQNVLVDDARLGEAVRIFVSIIAETPGAQWDGYEASIKCARLWSGRASPMRRRRGHLNARSRQRTERGRRRARQ
ncbi:ribonuclease E inhibitor RraB [Curtobacterium sp. SP.BCo]|uniref:ribonuclease E inhibitor RraB n=1 Tax=Curtobacterium sp. SP.BCo TaxID=3435229 RepID=UPI003F734ADB